MFLVSLWLMMSVLGIGNFVKTEVLTYFIFIMVILVVGFQAWGYKIKHDYFGKIEGFNKIL